MLGRGKSFSGIHRHLEKMLAWSMKFPQFTFLYQCVVDHLESLIQDSIAATTLLKNNQILAQTTYQLEVSIKQLSVLRSVYDNVEGLSHHIRNLNITAALFQSTLKNPTSNVIEWQDKIQLYCKGATCTSDEETMHPFATFSEQVDRSLEKYQLCSDLKVIIENLQTQIADEAIKSFEHFAFDLNVESMDGSSQRVQSKRIFLASKLFPDYTPGLGRSISDTYNTLVNNIISILMRRVGEMNEMAHVIEKEGLRNGSRDADVIIGLQSFCWFDDFVPEESRFLYNACINFERRYNDTGSTCWKEILLLDEVDVFFGADFYGQTYNQVTQIREPEIVSILNYIWNTNKRHGRRQRLADIQSLPAYSQLLAKMPQFQFLIDAEITLMINQVRKVDEEPYYLDRATDRIGYRIMDSISYEAMYGYRTVFAYLHEAERGNVKNRDATLAKALAMPVLCGQFSYANISPERILGVSGLWDPFCIDPIEDDTLSKYQVLYGVLRNSFLCAAAALTL